jgi:hypothetical protein
VPLTKYYSGDQIKENEMGRACSTIGEQGLVQKPEGNRPLERPMHRWEVAIKMDLKEVGGEVWTGLILLRIGTGGGLL